VINLTVSTDKYSDNFPITGTLTIKTTGGSAFHGTYKLSIYKVYVNGGASSPTFTINGATSYTWTSPFVLGPGSYKLSVSEIKNAEGTDVVAGSQLRNHVIYVFMG
jgi:hypothetical protein